MKKAKQTKKAGPTAEKTKKRVLGKGLDALIPELDRLDDGADDRPRHFFECRIDRIVPNRYQPRERFSQEELADLSRSIAEQGILQPLLVRDAGQNYELITGERRFRAAKMAGLATVPVILKEVSDAEMLELSIIENIQRENLNPIEEADAYHRLMTEFGMTQDAASKRLGKSRSAVANMLRLRNLPDEIKESISDGALTMGHARALLGAKNILQQMSAWRTVLTKGLSVRQTEALVDLLKKEAPHRPPKHRPASEDIYFSSLAEDLSRDFGTKVVIQRSGGRGKVIFEYYSNDELDRLLNLWKDGAKKDP